MKQTFKQYLIELMSAGDDNAIGGIVTRAKENLEKLSKNKSLSSICKQLLTVLDDVERTPTMIYGDGFSLVHYIQQLSNPKIDLRTLKHICDALQSYDNEGDA